MRSLNSLLDTRKMSKIMLLFGAFDIVLCEMKTKSETTASKISQMPSCRNPLLCHLSNTYKTKSKNLSFLPYPNSQNYGRQQLNLQRSYYNGFSTSASPTYYPIFDPISILASLAFLAFLLQSFTSLFDHSRSILPTIVNGRQTMNLKIPEISRHVSHALREYEILNEDM